MTWKADPDPSFNLRLATQDLGFKVYDQVIFDHQTGTPVPALIQSEYTVAMLPSTVPGVYQLLVERQSLGSFLCSFEHYFYVFLQHDVLGSMERGRPGTSRLEAASEARTLKGDNKVSF